MPLRNLNEHERYRKSRNFAKQRSLKRRNIKGVLELLRIT